jgi:glutaredoxin-like protein NrdH
MKKVIVYTKNRCPECEKVKQNLGFLPLEVKKNYTVEYRNIEDEKKGEEYHDKLIHLGYQSVPVTFIEGSAPIVGFNFGAIQDALGL